MRMFLLLATIAVLTGCGPKVFDDPIATMKDRTESPKVRLRAAEQAEAQMPDSEARLAFLRTAVWDRGYPVPLRQHAVDSLIRHDEADAKRHLAHAIRLSQSWETIEHILDNAVARGWTDFTPAIVRNYARPAWLYADDKRPERAAIEALNPDRTVEQVVFDTFVADGAMADANIKQRAAAWQLMIRLMPDTDALVAMLKQVDAKDPLIADLQAGARELNVVPVNMEEILWLQTIRTPAYNAFYNAAARAVGRLSPEQRRGLELRHLPTVIYAAAREPAMLELGFTNAYAKLSRQLAGQEHHLKGATFDGGSPTHPQLLNDWKDHVSWGDLVTCLVIGRAMAERTVVAEWFAQSDADHKDQSTEYGGLLNATGGDPAFAALMYKPFLRKHDLAYYATKQMIADSYIAVSHYHFHAQKTRNSMYASPGRGDLERIGDKQRLNGLVLTSIDERTLNVDFYRHGDVVIDLGVVRR